MFGMKPAGINHVGCHFGEGFSIYMWGVTVARQDIDWVMTGTQGQNLHWHFYALSLVKRLKKRGNGFPRSYG